MTNTSRKHEFGLQTISHDTGQLVVRMTDGHHTIVNVDREYAPALEAWLNGTDDRFLGDICPQLTALDITKLVSGEGAHGVKEIQEKQAYERVHGVGSYPPAEVKTTGVSVSDTGAASATGAADATPIDNYSDPDPECGCKHVRSTN